MDTVEERWEKERKHRADTEYEVWRRGYHPDGIDRERLRDCYDAGRSPEACAASHIDRIRHEAAARRRAQEEEEAYWVQYEEVEKGGGDGV